MKTRRTPHGLVVVVAAFALAACGAADDDAVPAAPNDSVDPPPAVDAPSPDGDWIATSGFADGAAVDLLDGWDVTMSIVGDQVTGTAACNGYGGDVMIGDDGSFRAGEIAITQMGCEAPIQELEQSFVSALSSFTSYDVDDDRLTLSGRGHEWVFERLAPVDDAAIVGTTWVLDTYIQGEAATNMPGMSDATLRLDGDGTLTGSTGCRQLSGSWIDTGAGIVFTEFAAEGECPSDLQMLDNVVLSVLGDGFTATVVENRLTVVSQDNEGLSYTAITTESSGASATESEESASVVSDNSVEPDPAGGVDGAVAYAAPATEGEEALLTGAVTLDGDCLRVGATVVIWPFGTSWQKDPAAVISPSGGTIPLGTTIEAGGGFHGLDTVDRFTDAPDVARYLESCVLGEDGVFVIQHRDFDWGTG